MALTIRDLTVDFGNLKGHSNLALQALDMATDAKRFVAIVGPSGCGKTTLLRVLMGLQYANAGEIRWRNSIVPHLGPYAAMVFQSPNLFPWRTIRANIGYGLELRGMKSELIADRVSDMLKLTGLQDHAEKRVHMLSGGMQQRVNLARALAMDPDVLLMDEPFSALDSILREQLQSELIQIWHEKQRLVLFVTHQLDEAVWLADEVLVMAAVPGRITQRIQVTVPRPRERNAETIAQLAMLQTEIRRHMLASGAYDGK